MGEEEKDQELVTYQVTLGGEEDHRTTYSIRPLSRFQIFKLTLIGLLGLAMAAIFLFATFIIGFILAIPLVLLGLFWYFRLAWLGRTRYKRDRF